MITPDKNSHTVTVYLGHGTIKHMLFAIYGIHIYSSLSMFFIEHILTEISMLPPYYSSYNILFSCARIEMDINASVLEYLNNLWGLGTE